MLFDRIINRVSHFLFTAVLLTINVISLTGGLLAKRKWNTALGFSSVFALLALLDWWSEKLAWQWLAEDTEALELYPWLFYVHLSYIVLVVAAVGTSSLMVLGKPKASDVSRKTVAAALTMSAVALIATFAAFSRAQGYVRSDILQGGFGYVHADSQAEYDAISFHKSIFLKDPLLWGEPSFVTPTGASEITGVVSFEGQPAITSIKLFLNEYWRTKTIKTDEHGRFSFSVGLREVEVNRISLAWWFNRPNDGLEYMPIIVEPILEYKDAFFDEASYEDRLRIPTARPQNQPGIEIRIVRFLRMIWPNYGDEEQKGAVHETSLEWEALPHASHYQVTISKYRNDRSGRPHLRLHVETNKFPLSELPLRKTTTPTKYYVVVAAFDKKGRFIGTSKSAFTRMWFSIPGHEIVGSSPRTEDCQDG